VRAYSGGDHVRSAQANSPNLSSALRLPVLGDLRRRTRQD
jgi:hypothetical protein